MRKIAADPLGSHRESFREAECELTEGAFRPASQASSSLLLEVCVPFRVLEGQVHLEAQAHQGMRRWLENFERVTLCAIIEPDAHLDQSMQWVPVQPLLDERLTLQFLPRSFRLREHLAHVRGVRQTFQALIPRHTHLCFSHLGWLGAWGSVASEEAYRLRRRYAIWVDWVLHQMPQPPESSLFKSGWRRVQSAMLKRRSLRDIRRSALTLCNGKSVYEGYAQHCDFPKLVHNVHLGAEDIISPARIQERLARQDGPLQVVYVGRVHEMKGPRHWLEALQRLLRNWRGSRAIRATWLGAGPLLDEMRQAVVDQNLTQYVSFPGHEASREQLLETLRQADVFAFCHLAPESPRALIEALMCGLPIIGFESEFAVELLGPHQDAGTFVCTGDCGSLALALGEYLRDPQRRRGMTHAAWAAGRTFSEQSVFKHRSELIKEYL